MIGELMAGLGVALAAVWYVLRPVLRPETISGDGGAATVAGADPDDDLSPRAVALRALKEIEFDRATAKLSEEDYAELKAAYTAEALSAMRAEAEAGAGSREPGAGTPVASPAPGARHPAPVCPEHGPRPESDAEFCSQCGKRLALAPAFCTRCGASLAADAGFCSACGAGVAA